MVEGGLEYSRGILKIVRTRGLDYSAKSFILYWGAGEKGVGNNRGTQIEYSTTLFMDMGINKFIMELIDPSLN